MLSVSPAWSARYPDCHAGILAMRAVHNPPHHPELEHRQQTLERELRARFSEQDRKALETLPVLQAYIAYYRRFKKTYHVQAQLESIVFKDRALPSGAALVEAMFMAELKNLLLTAGHDLDQVQLPVTLTVGDGSERYTLLRGQEQTVKAEDMLMADGAGVISSILYGPDQRTQITPETRNVLFAVYAPAGIGAPAVRRHLQDIRDHVQIVSPEAQVTALEVLGPESS
jgi:DNA/RNA-binding domain of Phe-tRNA-synthetase-like protein